MDTITQDIDKQRIEIHENARKNKLRIKEFVEVEMSSRKNPQARKIVELTGKLKLKDGDTLIVSELSHFGRSLVEVINLENQLLKKNVGVTPVCEVIFSRHVFLCYSVNKTMVFFTAHSHAEITSKISLKTVN